MMAKDKIKGGKTSILLKIQIGLFLSLTTAENHTFILVLPTWKV